MKKPKPRNEAALKRKGEKRLKRAKGRRAKINSLEKMAKKAPKQWAKREQMVVERSAPRRTKKTPAKRRQK